MDLSSNVKGLIFKTSFVILTCITLLWISVFMYGLLYYVYIPAVAHVKPVYLKYDTSCIKGSICKHPYDNITLIEKGHYELLRRGQIYAIEIVLEMPESENNLAQGMFMVRLDMLSQDGYILQSSRRPAILHYKSRLFKIIYTLFYIPGLLIGYVEEKQTVTISLFEQYMEDNYYPAHFAYIEIEAQTAEVYSANLRIHAQFTGLRYVMYYWPILSTTIGVGFNFFIMALTVVFLWIRQIMNSSDIFDDLTLKEKQLLKKDIKRTVRKQVVKKPGELSESYMSTRKDKFKLGSLSPQGDKKVLDTKKIQMEDIEVIEVEELPKYRDKKSPDIQKLQREELKMKNLPSPKDKNVQDAEQIQEKNDEDKNIALDTGEHPVKDCETSSDDWVDVSSSVKYEECAVEKRSPSLPESKQIVCEIHPDPTVDEVEEPVTSEECSMLRKRVLH